MRFIFIFIFIYFFATAQEISLENQLVEDAIVEELVEEIGIFEEVLDEFENILINPRNANDFWKIPFLSVVEIEKLIHYSQNIGWINDIEEIQATGLSQESYRLFKKYIAFTPQSPWRNWDLKKIQLKQQIDFRYLRKIEKQAGYFPTYDKDKKEKPPAFLGSPDALALRYRLEIKNYLRLGLIAVSREGEKIFKNPYYRYGADFYAGYLSFENLGILKKIIIGDYHAVFGQGINFYSAYGNPKSAQVISIEKNKTGIFPYTSLSPYRFLRGLAFEFAFDKHWQLFHFFSYRQKDANVENGQINSVYETFYHNTISGLAKKNQLNEYLTGLHLRYERFYWHWGWTGHYLFWDKKVKKEALYQKYFFPGAHLWVHGFDFSASYQHFRFFGEWSFSQNQEMAYILGSTFFLHPRWSMILVWRDYAKGYQNIYSQGFGEGNQTYNQKGVYWGFVITPKDKWEIQNYLDAYYRPFLTYNHPSPTWGLDFLSQISHSYQKKQLMFLRYRFKYIPKTSKEDRYFVTQQAAIHQLRYNIQYKLNDFLSGQNRVEVHFVPQNKAWGYLFFQDLSFKKKGFPLSGRLRYILFETTYDTRVYLYQMDIPSLYPIVFYQGKGQSFHTLLQYRFKKFFQIQCKYQIDFYPEQEKIGSGYTEIKGNTSSNVKIYFSYTI